MHHQKTIRRDSRMTTLFKAAAAVLLTLCIVLFPKQAFEASLQGLRIWWDIVFPGLLPFLILTEILMGYGFMHLFGVLLEPFMRASFRLPGSSGWAISMGVAAGYAAGVHTTARLRERQEVTQVEGEQLLATAYVCSPVFIISVVAAGFFHNIHVGWPLVIIHLSSWLAMGLTLRWMSKPTDSPEAKRSHRRGGRIGRALKAMNEAHQADGRGFGQMLGDAVSKSIQMMMMIGGFMMLFSVLLAIMKVTKLLDTVLSFLTYSLTSLGMPLESFEALMIGMFELHLGSFAASQTMLPSQWQAAIVSIILAWGGLSVHAQVKGIIHRTDLSIKRFIFARLLHSVYALILCLWWWEPLLQFFGTALPSSALPADIVEHPSIIFKLWALWNRTFLWFIGFLCLWLIGSVLIRGIQRVMHQ